jgi:DNA-directed RNA polymerase specialized sigma24 family protein
MAHVPNHDAATRVAFETAIAVLPPLTRVVFLLHRVDGLSYAAIARRLSIGVLAVENGVADAIYRICCTLNGDTAKRALPQPLADANALLSKRHRRYCERCLGALGVTLAAAVHDDDDTDAVVMRAMLLSMPPVVRETFVLSQIENLTLVQIALRMGTLRCVFRRSRPLIAG